MDDRTRMLQHEAAARKGSAVNWQLHLRLTWKQTPSKSSSLLQHLTRPVSTIRLHKLKERPFVNTFQLRKGSTLIWMDCDFQMNTRVCNTGNLFAPATRHSPRRRGIRTWNCAALNNTFTTDQTRSFCKAMENRTTIFSLFISTRRNARYWK